MMGGDWVIKPPKTPKHTAVLQCTCIYTMYIHIHLLCREREEAGEKASYMYTHVHCIQVDNNSGICIRRGGVSTRGYETV